MSRRQKLLLAILGLADLLVILAMGLYVFNHTRASPPPTPPEEQPVLSACTAYLLDSLADTGGSVVISWDDTAALINVTFPETTIREEVPQLLWIVLTNLSPQLSDVCPLPDTIQLQAVMPGPRVTHRHAIELSGAALNDWLSKEITDAELATRSRYRDLSDDLP